MHGQGLTTELHNPHGHACRCTPSVPHTIRESSSGSGCSSLPCLKQEFLVSLLVKHGNVTMPHFKSKEVFTARQTRLDCQIAMAVRGQCLSSFVKKPGARLHGMEFLDLFTDILGCGGRQDLPYRGNASAGLQQFLEVLCFKFQLLLLDLDRPGRPMSKKRVRA